MKNTAPTGKQLIGFDAKRANANRTGLGNYSRTVIDALAHRFPDFGLRLYVPRHRQMDAYSALLESENVTEHLPEGMWRKLSSLWRVFGIAPQLQRDGVTLFHGLSNELPTGLAQHGIRSIVTIHDLIFLRHPAYYRFFDRQIYTFKFRHACRVADRIVAASECTKRDIVHYFGTDPSKIEVIYQGCAPQFAIPCNAEEIAHVRTKYALPKRFMLNVGTIEERKNLLAAVKALAHLPDDIHLVAAGGRTPYTDRVAQYAAQYGLSGRVHLLHGVSFMELRALYGAAEWMVYPSRYEGFGIPIIEAISAGLPVVAATGSCLEEPGGPDCIYVHPDDDRAMADAILRIDADPALRHTMIERSREYIRRFDPEYLAGQMAELYTCVLK